jgi:PAS domain S-box-containing protein
MTSNLLKGRHDLTNGIGRYKSKSGIFSVDSKQNILYWSESAKETLGYSEQEIKNKKCYQILCPLKNNGICFEKCSPTSNSKRKRETKEFEVFWSDKKGDKKRFRVTTLFSNSSKNTTEIVHIFSDITKESPINNYLKFEDIGEDTYIEKLTPREYQSLKLLSTGLSIKEIAKVMFISQLTARNHIFSVMNKLEAKTQLQAVIKAAKLRLL